MRHPHFFAMSIALLLCSSAVLAQITITADCLPSHVGYRVRQQFSEGNVQLNAGSPGSNQIWDLRGIEAGQAGESEIVDRSTTPNPSWFPTANVIVKVEGDPGTTTYMYIELTSDYLKQLGMVYAVAESSWAVPQTNDPPEWIYPMHYQDSWRSRYYEEETSGGDLWTYMDTSWTVVDGWGTVIVDELGSVPALRLKIRRHTIERVNGVPINDVWTWNYNWMACDYIPQVVVMESGPGADENFTSGWFNRIGSISGAGEPVEIVPLVFQLDSPYPNPFNPETTIPYSIHQRTNVELVIYNVLGERVRTLAHGTMLPGHYSAIWDGRGDMGQQVGTGVYYCRLIGSDVGNSAQRLVLIR
jgi:hypothetical protein